ncbi:hypothetical protein [Streptomyces sp. NPDC021212]|uniref:hypothetical protein n=1 Tax=Streptomyces sp. NPDC021212 TaxID=3365118 RepID=UPI0037891346
MQPDDLGPLAGEGHAEAAGCRAGAVIQDRHGPLYWLVRPGTYWRIPVGLDRYLTDAARLREALVLAGQESAR